MTLAATSSPTAGSAGRTRSPLFAGSPHCSLAASLFRRRADPGLEREPDDGRFLEPLSGRFLLLEEGVGA